jgi:hypothetical protein
MCKHLGIAKVGDQIVVAGVILVVMRVDHRRDGTIRAEIDKGFLQSSTSPGEASIDHQRTIDEITDCVVVPTAKSTQQAREQVIYPNADDVLNRMSDGGAKRPKGKTATHQSEWLPKEKSQPLPEHAMLPAEEAD